MVDHSFTVSLTDGDKLEIKITGKSANLIWRNAANDIIDARAVNLPNAVYKNGAIMLYELARFLEGLDY